jgi:hypothetical protein
VQNTAEYLGRVARLLSFRGVSTEWEGAVSDAVGFLNGRCWTRVAPGTYSGPLWTSLRVDDPLVVARCAVLCLQPRLETVDWLGFRVLFPSLLFGDNNATLTALSLDSETFADTGQLRDLRGWKRLPNLEGSMVSHPVTDLRGLRGLVALRELSLASAPITDGHFAGIDRLLARLHKLDLRGCKQLKALSNLAPCVSLRELNLADSGIENLRGLEKLVALEVLDVSRIPACDWSILRQCPRLTALTAGVSGGAFRKNQIEAMIDNAAHCLCGGVFTTRSRDV